MIDGALLSAFYKCEVLRYYNGMKIDIKSTNLELTPSITQFIEEKIGSLDHFVPKQPAGGKETRSHAPVEAFVEIARTTKHHRQGDVFRAEVNFRIGGNMIRAEREDWDIRAAIDAVREELKAELQKEKGILESKFKRGARILKRLQAISPLAWFRKEQ